MSRCGTDREREQSSCISCLLSLVSRLSSLVSCLKVLSTKCTAGPGSYLLLSNEELTAVTFKLNILPRNPDLSFLVETVSIHISMDWIFQDTSFTFKKSETALGALS